jgi:hypothetical protein
MIIGIGENDRNGRVVFHHQSVKLHCPRFFFKTEIPVGLCQQQSPFVFFLLDLVEKLLGIVDKIGFALNGIGPDADAHTLIFSDLPDQNVGVPEGYCDDDNRGAKQ